MHRVHADPKPGISLPRIEAAAKVAESCVHFGFCTSVCPTYVLDGNENDSPRGRITLIKAMLESGRAPDPATVTHVDRCLSCLACVTTCAAGVDYRQLIDTAREYIEAWRVRPVGERLYRKLLTRVLSSARLLRTAMTLSRPFHGWLASLPGRAGALGRIAQAPGARAFVRRVEPSAEASHAGTRVPTRAVALLDGCVQSVLGAEINVVTRRVLTRAGVRVVEAPPTIREACCGALSLHLGDRASAVVQAAARVDHWASLLDTGAIDAVVITTSGCGSVVRHYDELFADDPLRLSRAQAVAKASMDVSELLEGLELRATDAHLGARTAYHDACSLRHGQRITRPPRKVLGALGYVVADVPEAHLCCGSAGTYNLLQPAIADRLGQRKAANITATRPDVIVAGNLGCLVQISRFTATPVAHLVQLVDWATGGPAPCGLEAFRPRATPAIEPSAGQASVSEACVANESTDIAFW